MALPNPLRSPHDVSKSFCATLRCVACPPSPRVQAGQLQAPRGCAQLQAAHPSHPPTLPARDMPQHKPGARGEHCSPDESNAKGQHRCEDPTSGQAPLWDRHTGTGRMSVEKLGITGAISRHHWKVHGMPPQQHLLSEITGDRTSPLPRAPATLTKNVTLTRETRPQAELSTTWSRGFLTRHYQTPHAKQQSQPGSSRHAEEAEGCGKKNKGLLGKLLPQVPQHLTHRLPALPARKMPCLITAAMPAQHGGAERTGTAEK